MTRLRQKASTVMRSGAGIAVSMVLMNIASYGFTMLAARELGPVEYGRMAAMMNLLLVISVASLGLQATAARRISSDPDHVHQVEHQVKRLIWRVALWLGAALLLAAPLIDRVLRLDNLALAALAGVAAVPTTLLGGYAGILQGERRWFPLGMAYVANGVPRLLVGGAMLAWAPSAFTAFLAVALCGAAPALISGMAVRGSRDTGARSDDHTGRAILKETLHNSQTLFAFFAVSNVDVLIARNALPDHEAGLYAGGVILAKILMFLPQFVVVIAFPSMSSAAARARTLSLGLMGVAAVGVTAIAAVTVASPLALPVVGGNKFAEIQDQLWAFAVLGTLLALLQLLVYSVLARRGQRSAYLLWIALVVQVVGGISADTVGGLLAWVAGVNGVLVFSLVVISYFLVNRTDDKVEAEEPLPSAV